jgi:hypothetical protein
MGMSTSENIDHPVLWDENYNVLAPEPKATSKQEEPKSKGLSAETVTSKIIALTRTPPAVDFDELLRRIAGVRDNSKRDLLFNIVRDNVQGGAKDDVKRARSAATKTWKEKEKKKKRVSVSAANDDNSQSVQIVGSEAFPNLVPGNRKDLPDCIEWHWEDESCFIKNCYSNALTLIGLEDFRVGFDEIEVSYFFLSENLPWKANKKKEITKATLRHLRHYLLAKWGAEFSIENITEACLTLAGHNSFNPIVDYLDSLVWDGIARLDRWHTTYLGSPDTEYVRAVGVMFLVAAVRRAKYPGTKFDTMPIYEGPQGSGKSSFLEILGGRWYSGSSLGDITDKEAAINLQGVWFKEWPEIVSLLRHHPDDVKAFVSLTEDRYRAPYDAAPSKHPRHTVFTGTYNPREEGYLTDDTGNRRYDPVPVSAEIDLAGVARDRDQLFAEAVVREREGMSIVLPRELWADAAREQAARMVTHQWLDIVSTHIDDVEEKIKEAKAGQTELKMSFLSEDLLCNVLNIDREKRLAKHPRDLRVVMESLGFELKDLRYKKFDTKKWATAKGYELTEAGKTARATLAKARAEADAKADAEEARG